MSKTKDISYPKAHLNQPPPHFFNINTHNVRAFNMPLFRHAHTRVWVCTVLYLFCFINKFLYFNCPKTFGGNIINPMSEFPLGILLAHLGPSDKTTMGDVNFHTHPRQSSPSLDELVSLEVNSLPGAPQWSSWGTLLLRFTQPHTCELPVMISVVNLDF
jgi:hypothetical protein